MKSHSTFLSFRAFLPRKSLFLFYHRKTVFSRSVFPRATFSRPSRLPPLPFPAKPAILGKTRSAPADQNGGAAWTRIPSPSGTSSAFRTPLTI